MSASPARSSSPISYQQDSGDLLVRVPFARLGYLKNIMRSDSFDALWPLFKQCNDPCKEFTESYAAHKWMSRWRSHPKTVFHVGDGAHCRTAALFAFMTRHTNIAIDPQVREEFVGSWKHRFNVERFYWFKGRVEDYPLEDVPGPCLVTFVHAHVDTDKVLKRLGNKWVAAYTNACCEAERQLGQMEALESGEDWSILSPQRAFKVIVNPLHYAEMAA